MKRFKRVISFVLTMALILPILPIPEVQADDTETTLTGQVSVVKSGNGEGTITVNGSDIGELFEQEYEVDSKVELNAKAKDGSKIDYVKIVNGENEENIFRDDMYEYSNSIITSAEDLKIEVSFAKVEVEEKTNNQGSEVVLDEKENASSEDKSEKEKSQESDRILIESSNVDVVVTSEEVKTNELVNFDLKIDEGYSLYSVSIYNDKGSEVLANVDKLPKSASFYMPEGNVVISAEAIPEVNMLSADDSRELRPGITMREFNSGGNRIEDVIPGATKSNVTRWLNSHRNDNYYLGTHYPGDQWGNFVPGRNGGTDRRNPNGDCGGQNGFDDFAGQAMMNCTGFVWHVLYKASGMGYQDAWNRIPAWGGVGAGNWRDFLRNNRVEYRTYYAPSPDYINPLIDSITTDNYVEPGDIIWTWDGAVSGDGLPSGTSGSHHVGIFTGSNTNLDNGTANYWWHSLGHCAYLGKWYNTNFISNILPKNPCTAITVIKLSDRITTGEAQLQKQSSNGNITNGNSNYSLAGAVYGVYSDSACTKKVGDLTTDANGNSNVLTLNAGTYYVKETKASPGYDLDTNKYTVTVKTGSKAIVKSKEPPRLGKIKVEKTSSKPDVTNGNENYSLKGAEYSIYKDQKCTNYVNKIVTDENGKGSLGNLPLGVYYVKETKASPGYNKDPQIYKVNISSGQAAVIEGTVKSKEVPLLDPVSILLRKVDSDTGKPNTSLAGAQFRVKYYTKIMDTDPALSGQKPDRQWIFETDKDGFLGFDKSHFVSGDALYTSADGRPALPYGTLTFEEIKAPEGYHINSKIIVAKIPKDSNNSGTIIYQEPTQLENAIKLKLKKVHNGTTKPISGAVFSHINPDGTMESLTTDRNGQIEIKGLKKGNHTIQETSVPDGYAVNKNKITFTVDDSGKIKITSDSTETDTDGTIVLNVNKDGDLEATVNEKPAPFDFKIVKASDKGNKLAGAEFTLYSDKDCKTEVGKQVSGKDGVLKFEDLIVGKMYYMKETKAPEGYRIPVNSDGSDIVYTIKVNSVPVDNVFTVEFNGKVYDSSSGDIVLEGTKADRVVTANIINKAGMKLPETGSSDMIFIMLMGVGFMVLGLKRRTVK